MLWNNRTGLLFVAPTLNDVGVYEVAVKARPGTPELEDLVATDTFRLFVEESCALGFRFVRLSTFTEGGLQALRCAATDLGFLSYWKVPPACPFAQPRNLRPRGPPPPPPDLLPSKAGSAPPCQMSMRHQMNVYADRCNISNSS